MSQLNVLLSGAVAVAFSHIGARLGALTLVLSHRRSLSSMLLSLLENTAAFACAHVGARRRAIIFI